MMDQKYRDNPSTCFVYAVTGARQSVMVNPHTASGWRIHCCVDVTELSTNKQHTLSVCARGRHTSFGAMRALCKGEVGTRALIGYSFIVRETWGRTGQEDEGGVKGSRTSVVFVQATRRVEKEEEFFANYGDSFRFPHGCSFLR